MLRGHNLHAKQLRVAAVVVVAQGSDELGHSVRERERFSLVDVWRKRQ